MTDFDSNTFENDYIMAVLQHMVADLKTAKSVEQIIDKYAVELTAFMTGQIRAVVKSDFEAGPATRPAIPSPQRRKRSV